LDNQSLLAYIQASPTPFHAVSEMRALLDKAGFTSLKEGDEWSLDVGGKYYVTRNGSSLIAFTLPATGDLLVDSGIRMMGAHTDSPCLKIKPNPDVFKNGFHQLGVEKYGGVLLNPWFDRDLSLAGRVSYATKEGVINSTLVDFKNPVAVIPSLAIHLDREANENRTVNPQLHMPPIMAIAQEQESVSFKGYLAQQLTSQGLADVDVLDYEICCYDTQPPAIIGLNAEFIASARLDNLLSCYVGLQALIDSNSPVSNLLICNDHEEVGSTSAVGAHGTFLKSVLERLCTDPRSLSRLIANSLMISIDNAHGVHPNYADKHDEQHGPMLNGGPVIKVNSSQRYATNSESAAIYRQICRRLSIPVQSFVVRSDMGCGTTIGPITAKELGVRTLDIGIPTFAMHSVRELAGSQDTQYLYQSLIAVCELADLPS